VANLPVELEGPKVGNRANCELITMVLDQLSQMAKLLVSGAFSGGTCRFALDAAPSDQDVEKIVNISDVEGRRESFASLAIGLKHCSERATLL
jgi:hypothetical protein